MNIFELIENEMWETDKWEGKILNAEAHNKSLEDIRKVVEELQMQLPKIVKPIIILQITVNNVTRVSDNHLHTWYKCPLCNRAVCKTDIFCNCGVKLDWSEEKK